MYKQQEGITLMTARKKEKGGHGRMTGERKEGNNKKKMRRLVWKRIGRQRRSLLPSPFLGLWKILFLLLLEATQKNSSLAEILWTSVF
jgi:hypothetical protein